jgi:enolase
MKIKDIKALEILDSRGNPTISARVLLEDASLGASAVPSGASTGAHEAVELRDKDKNRYHGAGVLRAIDNIENKIFPALKDIDAYDQKLIDQTMIDLDGTENKENLGANAILAVSMACARAAAQSLSQPLYQYLRNLSNDKDENKNYTLPVPMMNLLNGGRHADWSTDIQEYMVLPVGANTFSEAVRMVAEIYQSLKKILKEKDYKVTVGDEGGFAPAFKNNEEPFQFLSLAVKAAGYSLGKDIVFGIDAAATEFYQDGVYHLNKENKKFDSLALINFYQDLATRYPILSFEDPLAEDDWSGFKLFTEKFAENSQVVGDDLYVTKVSRLERGIKEGSSNSILIKLNQIGTISETVAAIELAKSAGLTAIISHRSGETEDTFIADFAVAMATGQIKTGAPCRSERTAKYNRLLQIESELKDQVSYARFPFSL